PDATGPYDELNFIWKQFKRNGYKTALIEDDPHFTLFNYNAKGFTRKPTDWYPRPYWIHIYNEDKLKRSGYCYNKEPRIEILLNQAKQFISKMGDNPYFLFNFLIEVTHNDFNYAQLVDSHYANFIKVLKRKLKKSVFILMGDHGMRFGKILETFSGRVEERMPLFAIHLPSSLTRKYPHLKKYLRLNEARLISWFDVHQVMVDIAN
ncbi:uncharacterized protein B4U79_05900, partial [Dinothrombium tinctorium]